MAHYVYDHSGERVLKTIITGSILNTNSQGQSVLRMESPTVYVNPYYIASHYLETELASKHYYMGSQRIASALVSLPFNAGSQTDPGMGGEGEEGEGPVFGEGNLSTSEDAVIQDLSATFNCLFGRTIELDYDGMLKLISIGEPILFDDCEGGVSTEASEIDPTCACEQSTYWAQIGGVACNTMPIMYWYHPDYLGSVEFVTDMNGNPYQFFHNTIWGENLQNHMAFSFKSFSSRFRFNGKEWDEETGNFYYGARYYDPKISVWLSVDPLAHEFPYISPYNFVENNPLRFSDPTGMGPEDEVIGQTTYNGISVTYQAVENSKIGNDVVTQRLMRGTRIERTLEDGSTATVYQEERITRTATVSLDGVSEISETSNIVEKLGDGTILSDKSSERSYSLSDNVSDDGFSNALTGVNVHRIKSKQPVSQHIIEMIESGTNRIGDVQTLGLTSLLASACPTCGVIAGGIGLGSWLTARAIEFGYLGPEDFRVELGYFEKKGKTWEGSKRIPFAW